MNQNDKLKVGFGICGSFCCFSQVLPVVKTLVDMGYDVLPIMSQIAYSTDTRFGKAKDHIEFLESTCGKSVIHTIDQAEPIGPRALIDLMVIAPCTGNTIAKIALGITDTPVTLAAKANLRNMHPVVIAVSTNDGLSANGQNIGKLMNTKNVFLVPFQQDDPLKKTTSLVARFEMIPQTIAEALKGMQIQPVLLQ